MASTVQPGTDGGSAHGPVLTPRRRSLVRSVGRVLAGAAALLMLTMFPAVSVEMLEARRVQETAPPPAVARAAPPAPLANEVPALPAVEAIAVNRHRPFEKAPEQAPPFVFAGGPSERARALDCLAAAAIYEAGDDSPGQRAVIQVVLNRARHPSFPATLCGVVFQGSERKTGCQFTFTCDGSLARTHSAAVWARARALASAALDGAADAAVGSATHYHADYVVPWWSSSLVKLSQVGAHIFYRWPGSWGRPGILRRTAGQQEPLVAALARVGGAHGAPGATDLPAAVASAGPVPAAAAADPAAGRPAVAESTIMIAASLAEGSGRWAMDALRRCDKLAECLVLAYRDADQLRRNRAAAADAREAPLFLFVRDGASARELALWDCSQVARPDQSQCLPTDRAALRRLVRDRSG